MRFILLLIAAFALFGCNTHSMIFYRNFSYKNDQELRFLTYNVNWGQDKGWKKNDTGPTLQAIHVIDADINALTEVTPKWRKLFNKNFAKQFPYQTYLHHHSGTGLGILSKYPIEVKRYFPSSIGWYPALLVDVKTPHGKIQLLLVHLIPPHAPHSTDGLPRYSFFKRSYYRQKEFIDFYRQLNLNKPTIITGDFNESDDGRTIHFLNSQRFADCMAAIHGYDSSWHWPLGIVTLGGRNEHLFYSPAYFNLLHAQILHEGNSDHFPLVTDFAKK